LAIFRENFHGKLYWWIWLFSVKIHWKLWLAFGYFPWKFSRNVKLMNMVIFRENVLKIVVEWLVYFPWKLHWMLCWWIYLFSEKSTPVVKNRQDLELFICLLFNLENNKFWLCNVELVGPIGSCQMCFLIHT